MQYYLWSHSYIDIGFLDQVEFSFEMFDQISS